LIAQISLAILITVSPRLGEFNARAKKMQKMLPILPHPPPLRRGRLVSKNGFNFCPKKLTVFL
jgi:hypothetical protein